MRFLFFKKCLLSAACLACITLFCVHPVGCQARVYSLLWVLPVVNIFVKHKSFFVNALAGVCATHALGSVLWIYTHQTTPLFWIGLLPISCAERILFAAGAWSFERAREFLCSASQPALSKFLDRAHACVRLPFSLLRNKLGYISLLVIFMAVFT